MLKNALAITLIASSIGAADVFLLRKKNLELGDPPPELPSSKGGTASNNPPARGTGPEPTPPSTSQPTLPGPATPATPSQDLPAGMITLEKTIELFGRMMSAGDVRFVDARNEEDFVKGRIPTAVCLPPTKFGGMTPPEVDQLQRDATIVIYCGGGECDASKLTALRLRELGFNTTLIFHDGFPAWEKAGQPVEK